MQCQPHTRFRCHRHYGVQKIGDIVPHIVNGVHALRRYRRQILDAPVVESGQSRAGPPDLFVVTLHQAMCIEVVLDHRQARPAGRANRLPYLFDFFVPARYSVDGLRKPANHHVAQSQTAGLQALHARANSGFFPWNRRTAHGHVIHAQAASRGACRLHPGRRPGACRTVPGKSWAMQWFRRRPAPRAPARSMPGRPCPRLAADFVESNRIWS